LGYWDGIYEGLPAPAAETLRARGPRTGRGTSSVPIGVTAHANLVALTGLGVLTILPGMQFQPTLERFGHTRSVLRVCLPSKTVRIWYRRKGTLAATNETTRLPGRRWCGPPSGGTSPLWTSCTQGSLTRPLRARAAALRRYVGRDVGVGVRGE